jgi:hypothetical protein
MVMHHIEFLAYPTSASPTDLQWGIRIDGTDLRVYAADATRDFWRQEHEEDSLEERERFLLLQHDGLAVSEVGDPVRHFLGDPAPDFAAASGAAGPC